MPGRKRLSIPPNDSAARSLMSTRTKFEELPRGKRTQPVKVEQPRKIRRSCSGRPCAPYLGPDRPLLWCPPPPVAPETAIDQHHKPAAASRQPPRRAPPPRRLPNGRSSCSTRDSHGQDVRWSGAPRSARCTSWSSSSTGIDLRRLQLWPARVVAACRPTFAAGCCSPQTRIRAPAPAQAPQPHRHSSARLPLPRARPPPPPPRIR